MMQYVLWATTTKGHRFDEGYDFEHNALEAFNKYKNNSYVIELSINVLDNPQPLHYWKRNV